MKQNGSRARFPHATNDCRQSAPKQMTGGSGGGAGRLTAERPAESRAPGS